MDENIKVLVTYREDASRDSLFIDDDWGYETGLALIRQGADVIFAAGGVTGEGTLRAALDEQVEAIGAERDQGAAGYGVVSSVYGRASFRGPEYDPLAAGRKCLGAGEWSVWICAI
ncbi:MAG: BMP family ABC transporter substrate-binding protein [Anaerolineales bacterium]|nr:BMP family ABC transporter substrate-binding protein [Anaerolineales bacterium]